MKIFFLLVFFCSYPPDKPIIIDFFLLSTFYFILSFKFSCNISFETSYKYIKKGIFFVMFNYKNTVSMDTSWKVVKTCPQLNCLSWEEKSRLNKLSCSEPAYYKAIKQHTRNSYISVNKLVNNVYPKNLYLSFYLKKIYMCINI